MVGRPKYPEDPTPVLGVTGVPSETITVSKMRAEWRKASHLYYTLHKEEVLERLRMKKAKV